MRVNFIFKCSVRRTPQGFTYAKFTDGTYSTYKVPFTKGMIRPFMVCYNTGAVSFLPETATRILLLDRIITARKEALA